MSVAELARTEALAGTATAALAQAQAINRSILRQLLGQDGNR